jgi:hypothetical protein
LTFDFDIDLTLDWTILFLKAIYIYRDLSLQVGKGLQYLHRSPASSKGRVIRDDVKGTQCPRVYLGHPVPGGYKYGNLPIQVGGVSDETGKYGYGFCATRTIE